MSAARGYLVRRLWQLVPTLLGVVLLVFLLFNWVGGDPAQVLAGKISNPKDIENIRHQLGVDRPYWEQLLIFLRQIVTADFGRSWSTHENVSDILLSRAGPSLTIMVPIMVLETVLGVVFAMLAAYFRGTLTDRIIMAACTAAMSISFLVYIIVGQYLFGFVLGWFPVVGWSGSTLTNLATYAPLPVMLAVAVGLAPTIRLYRSYFVEEMSQDYVRTARAKGLSEFVVLGRHVLRNSLIPIITSSGALLPVVITSTIVTETFFAIPGLGNFTIEGITQQDFGIVRAMVFVGSVLYILSYLLVDVLYTVADPRVRLQ